MFGLGIRIYYLRYCLVPGYRMFGAWQVLLNPPQPDSQFHAAACRIAAALSFCCLGIHASPFLIPTTSVFYQ